MKTLAIVQARMGSSRLPGKTIIPVKGRPLIAHTLKRLKFCKQIDHVILATSTNDRDRVLLDIARQEDVEGFAGSENDLLDRYYQAAISHRPQNVVRCTGDCPILDPEITDRIIQFHLDGGYDYTSNTLQRTYPRGYDTEVMTFGALEKASKEARQPYEREHVTPYIWEHPLLFKLGRVLASPGHSFPDLRVTVDTAEDLKLIISIFEALYDSNPAFNLDAVIKLFRERPELKLLNAHVEQKDLKK